MYSQPIVIYSSWSQASLITALSAQNLAEWFKSNGYEPIEIVGLSANRMRLFRVMRHAKMDMDEPRLIVYMGHGYPNSFVGFEPSAESFLKSRLVVEGQNDDLFEGCIVHTIACETAQSLGPSMVKKGATAFFGSTEKMIVGGFEQNKEYVSDFIELFTVIPKILAEGYTTGEAYRAYREMANEMIMKYTNNPDWPNVDFYRDAMIKNYEYYKLIGDESATWRH